MQRYRTKSDAEIGNKILFDNTLGFVKNMPRVKVVGEVIAVKSADDNILVSFNVNGEEEPIEAQIPFFLAQ